MSNSPEHNEPLTPRQEMEFYNNFSKVESSSRQPVDLGFASSEELQSALDTLNKLLRHPDVSPEVIGMLQSYINQNKGITAQRDREVAVQKREEISRRDALRHVRSGLLIAGGVIVGGGGIVGGAIEGVDKMQAFRHNKEVQKETILEKTHTLGLVPTAQSERGWTAYYAPADKHISYVDTGVSLSLQEGDVLQEDPKKGFLYDTSIKVYKHDRSNGQIIPKIHIRTQSSVQDSKIVDDASEEWVLRKDPDQLARDIDSRVLILEKQDQVQQQPLKYYLDIDYLGHEQFAATIMQRQVNP